MPHKFADIAFTPNVRAAQAAHGSADAYQRQLTRADDVHGRFGPDEAAFIAARDSFYMASVGENDWPYVQHRGGPPGFLKLLGDTTLGFADLAGNRQYISLGNIAGNNRVCLFLMDYRNRQRLKIYGRAETTTDPAVLGQLAMPGQAARIERAWIIQLAGFDWNCPQHITQRFTLDEIALATQALNDRIAALEAALSAAQAGNNSANPPGSPSP